MNYEEKLKEAKRLYQTANSNQKYVLESLFPELAESEDEKIRKALIRFHKSTIDVDGIKGEDIIAWLEKQGKCKTDCHRNHQDANHPKGCIVLEDFNGGEGFYKVHLDYLNEKQVKEVEEMVRTWNKDSKVSNENIKSCVGMCLTDVCEQRFKDYNTSLKDCLAWLEKQGEQKSILNVPPREVILSIWDLGNEWKELTNGSISTEYGTQLDYIQKHWTESEYYLREKLYER